MKYFTPELLSMVRSLDDAISSQGHTAWEKAIDRYHRRLRTIQNKLPRSVNMFREQLCLHDAQVISMAQQDQSFFMVLQLEPPSRTMVFLTFSLDESPKVHPTALSDNADSSYITWMYDEFDLDRAKNFTFSVLLSNGWDIKLKFKGFQFLIGQDILPTRNGRLASPSNSQVPRSA